MSKYYDKVKRKRREADKMWKRAVYEEWGELCEVCGGPASDPHHFVPKSLSGALRLDIKNGVPLCRKCHFAHHHKGDPDIHVEIINKRGEDWYDYLQDHRRDDVTTSLSFYEEKMEKLKEILNA